jgi:AcrR family transcriptional regulator
LLYGGRVSTLVVDPASPETVDEGRRERKKRQTRRALHRAALELFATRGVDQTTVEDIADAVDVSARTFHRYFASKEEVLFSDAAERRQRLATLLADRPVDETLLDSVRSAVHRLTDAFMHDPDEDRRRHMIIRSSPTLRGLNLHHTDLLSQVVADHAAHRLAVDPDDALPRLLAASTIAAWRTARERTLDDPSRDPHVEIDRCFDLLGHLDAATTPRSRPRR